MEAGWSDPALRGIFFKQFLNDTTKDHLCTQPEAQSFEELLSTALRSDTCLRERQNERSHQSRNQSPNNLQQPIVTNVSSPSELPRKPPDEPMQLGHSRLSAEER